MWTCISNCWNPEKAQEQGCVKISQDVLLSHRLHLTWGFNVNVCCASAVWRGFNVNVCAVWPATSRNVYTSLILCFFRVAAIGNTWSHRDIEMFTHPCAAMFFLNHPNVSPWMLMRVNYQTFQKHRHSLGSYLSSFEYLRTYIWYLNIWELTFHVRIFEKIHLIFEYLGTYIWC